MVHRRELNGEAIVLGNQGDLWGNAMTWWDHETGSIWSQPLGAAIAGPLKGAALDRLPVTLTDWASWRSAHPHTLALDAPGGRSGFSLDLMAIVVDLGDEAAAYPYREIEAAGGVINDVVGGVEIAVVLDPGDPESWAVFSRRLDDRVVTLATEDGRLLDEGGTEWDPVRGIGLDGPLAGEVLGLLPGFTSFPSDFRTFWPEGRIWPG